MGGEALRVLLGRPANHPWFGFREGRNNSEGPRRRRTSRFRQRYASSSKNVNYFKNGEDNLVEYSRKPLNQVLKEKIFYNISNIDLIELSDLFMQRKYTNNEILAKAGEKWDKVFFIHQGIIRLFYTDRKGREHNKGFFWENQLLWPVAPSARKNDIRFSISALENVTVSVCSFSSFYSWLTHHGYWEKFALPYAELLVEDKFRREYEFLMNSATERFRHFCIEYSELVKRIPDYHLASYLGITNVTLSRIKKSADFNLC